MENYDFSAPLAVTIVYEDSSNEGEVESSFHERATPKLHDDGYVEHQPSVQEDQEKALQSLKSKPKQSQIDSYGTDLNLRRKINHSESDKSSEKSLKKSKMDNISISDFSSVNDTNCSNNVFNGQLNSNGHSENDLTKAVLNDNSKKTCCEHLNINKSTVSDGARNTNKQDYDEINRYLNVLLENVSESLIHILEAYHVHLSNVVNHGNDVLFVQDSKKRYIRIKYHFYQLSYCTAGTVILSRENDTKFVDTFLSHTVEMGKRKKINLTTEQIKPFYYEMMSWVKQKRDFKNFTPELRYQLEQPPKALSFQNSMSNPTINCNLDYTRNSSSEIKITTVNNQNETILLYSNVVGPQPQVNSERLGVQSLRTVRAQNYPMTHSIQNNDKLTNSSNNKQPEGINKTTHLCRNNFVDLTATTKGNYPTYINTHNFTVSNPMNTRFPPSYEQSCQRIYPSYISRNHESGISTDQSIYPQSDFDITRSSVSTDSGYVCSDNIYSTDDNTFLKETSTALAPYITHVTSLNPKALQMLEGLCQSCGVVTKTKCLGCYQIYYCSYHCQKLDWKTHEMSCGQNSAARQYNDYDQNKRVKY